MKRIGIFICNYNGKVYAMDCIKSLHKQTKQKFDLYVVDNASTDGSVETLKSEFGDSVHFLLNEENLGGTGGFERGLQEGLKCGYEYIVLLDNDIVLKEDMLERMEDFMDDNPDAGIAGARVMIMDEPERMQEYGCYLDFEKFDAVTCRRMEKETPELPEVLECDYVPTCAVMIRADIMRKTGTMPKHTYIYYDDIELAYKMKLAGYRVVSLGNAKVWHKGGFRKAAVNTFPKYYFLRNRLYFFAKYIQEEEISRFVAQSVSSIFWQLFGFYNKGMEEMFQTTIFAFNDFLNQVTGKAADGKIMKIKERELPFQKVVGDSRRICIEVTEEFVNAYKDYYYVILFIIDNIVAKTGQEVIWFSLERTGLNKDEFISGLRKVLSGRTGVLDMPEVEIADEKERFDLRIRLCEHVKMAKENILPIIYTDRFCNCITTEEEYSRYTNADGYETFFRAIYEPLMYRAIEEIRGEKGQEKWN